MPAAGDEAVSAWLSIPGTLPPVSVTPVQIRADSAVYRLRRSSQADVLAKKLPDHSVERQVYERVLPQLEIASAPYIGSVESGQSEWIFLEDVGGEPYNWAFAHHRQSAARWLFAAHAAAAGCSAVRELPPRGLAYWRHIVLGACDLARSVPGKTAAAFTIVRACDETSACWDEVARVAGFVPETLVHGDLVPKNIRVVDSGAAVCPIDWGSAGFGVGAIDFAYIDARTYWAAGRESGHHLTLADVRRLSSLGRLLRNLLLVSWLCEEAHFASADCEAKLSIYARWIRTELRILRSEPV
jgi:aminoglycoside phosphotransferase (APT) family kinase protein